MPGKKKSYSLDVAIFQNYELNFEKFNMAASCGKKRFIIFWLRLQRIVYLCKKYDKKTRYKIMGKFARATKN